MRVTIHQPDFAPWLGFFNRLAHSDLFIILDDVSFNRYGWQHRDKVKTPTGAQWLTIPVKKSGRAGELIKDVELQDFDWRKKHIRTLETYYGKAPFFMSHKQPIFDIYTGDSTLLADFNCRLLSFFIRFLGIEIETVYASKLGAEGTKSEKLIDLIRRVGGTSYLSGLGARDYLDEDLFVAAGISVEWQSYKHPTYPQLFGTFEPSLSIIDAYFNCGDKCRKLIG